MVGNADDAALAKESYATGDKTYLLSDAGTSRMVYLINDVVYKIAYWSGAENLWEFNNREKYLSVPGVRVPDMTLYDDVLAMEYIDGDPSGECIGRYALGACDCEGTETDMPLALLDILSQLSWDSTMGNAIVRDDIYYLIDLA